MAGQKQFKITDILRFGQFYLWLRYSSYLESLWGVTFNDSPIFNTNDMFHIVVFFGKVKNCHSLYTEIEVF